MRVFSDQMNTNKFYQLSLNSIFTHQPYKTCRQRSSLNTLCLNPKPRLSLRILATADPSSHSNSSSESRSINGCKIVVRLGEAFSLGFPIWMCSVCVVGLCRPSTFLWVGRDWQILGLTVTMLGMGMMLTLDDLRAVLLMPKELAVGFILQYTVMPLSGYFVSKLLKLPPYYAAGLIWLPAALEAQQVILSRTLHVTLLHRLFSPSYTRSHHSNAISSCIRGNVALSVLMTAESTLTAVVMTAFLTSKLAGQFVAVDPVGLFVSTVQVVLTAVLIGAALNQYCNDLVKLVSPLMPFIAVASVSILGGGAVAQNALVILTSGFQVMVASFSLHASGFFFGYWISRMLGIDVSSSCTILIEVGMQNATLGLVLASQHFGTPLAAVTCAVSGICH